MRARDVLAALVGLAVLAAALFSCGRADRADRAELAPDPEQLEAERAYRQDGGCHPDFWRCHFGDSTHP